MRITFVYFHPNKIAALPIYKQIRRFYTEDDLVVLTLDNGNLASFLLINHLEDTSNSNNRSAEREKQIKKIRQM